MLKFLSHCREPSQRRAARVFFPVSDESAQSRAEIFNFDCYHILPCYCETREALGRIIPRFLGIVTKTSVKRAKRYSNTVNNRDDASKLYLH